MNLKNTIMMLVLISVLSLVNFIVVPTFSQIEPPIVPLPSGPFEKFGPRIDRLTFKVAGSVPTENLMLENGEIDLMDWTAPAAKWGEWLANPDITMGEYSEMSDIYFALNNARWPLGHGDQLPTGWSWDDFGGAAAYRGSHNLSLWPTELEGGVSAGGTADTYYVDYNDQRDLDARWFRRALSYLWNSAAQIAAMQGAGTPLDTLVFPAIHADWENPEVHNMYLYNVTAAEEALENGGFQDYDEDGTLEYSPGHLSDPPGTAGPADMEELPTLQFYTRQDDSHRINAATLLSQEMDLIGIPNDVHIVSSGIASTFVWQYPYDYDIYTEYWDWGVPLPDIYYEGFHSRKDIYPASWADNSVRYHSLQFDAYADDFLTAPTAADAKSALFEAQKIFHEDAVVIPEYTYVGFQGHRTEYGNWPGEGTYAGKNWTGFNNEPGVGFYSYWTMLNAHVEGLERGGTLRHGLVNDVISFNILGTWWFYDLQVLLQIYEGLAVLDPQNTSDYIPWLAESYEVGTWSGPSGLATAINFTLIPGILWHDNTLMTAEDVAFSFQYMKDAQAVNYLMNVKDFNSAVIYPNTPTTGKETIEIRFDILSWLALGWASGVPIIPKHIWGPEGFNVDPSVAQTWDIVGNDAVIGTGPFRFYKDGVVGRVDRVLGSFIYLERNPNYFRKLVRPDFFPQNNWPAEWDTFDGVGYRVELDDFMTAVGQFGTAYPTWHPTWGPLADVNKDRVVDIDDLMEIAVRFGATGYIEGYPPYYM